MGFICSENRFEFSSGQAEGFLSQVDSEALAKRKAQHVSKPRCFDEDLDR